MKRYLSIFNKHTMVVLAICAISSWSSIHFRLGLYVDFVILGLLVVFPLTLGIKEAFKRRERALQYLAGYKANILSLMHGLSVSKLDEGDVARVRTLVLSASEQLHVYLSGKGGDSTRVEQAMEAIPNFIQLHRKALKGSVALKLQLFFAKVREHSEFLVATKRYHTPVGLRSFLLLTIYAFIIFYPASLLHDQGFELSFVYVFAMTAFKGVLLMALYNIQAGLEDCFLQGKPDAVRLGDMLPKSSDMPLAPVSALSPQGNDDDTDDEDQ